MENVSPLAAPSPKHKISLIKAGYGQCRFLVSEPPARPVCCGAPTEDGRRLVHLASARGLCEGEKL